MNEELNKFLGANPENMEMVQNLSGIVEAADEKTFDDISKSVSLFGLAKMLSDQYTAGEDGKSLPLVIPSAEMMKHPEVISAYIEKSVLPQIKMTMASKENSALGKGIFEYVSSLKDPNQATVEGAVKFVGDQPYGVLFSDKEKVDIVKGLLSNSIDRLRAEAAATNAKNQATKTAKDLEEADQKIFKMFSDMANQARTGQKDVWKSFSAGIMDEKKAEQLQTKYGDNEKVFATAADVWAKKKELGKPGMTVLDAANFADEIVNRGAKSYAAKKYLELIGTATDSLGGGRGSAVEPVKKAGGY